jgi:hypothetical protein
MKTVGWMRAIDTAPRLPLSGGQRFGIAAQLVAMLIGCLSGKACTMREASGCEPFHALWPISIYSVDLLADDVRDADWVHIRVCKKRPIAYRR